MKTLSGLSFEIFYLDVNFQLEEYSLLNKISFSRFLEQVDSRPPLMI